MVNVTSAVTPITHQQEGFPSNSRREIARSVPARIKSAPTAAGAVPDSLSAGYRYHAKRVLAQPVSNGTLINGSDRLWRNIQTPSTRA